MFFYLLSDSFENGFTNKQQIYRLDQNYAYWGEDVINFQKPVSSTVARCIDQSKIRTRQQSAVSCICLRWNLKFLISTQANTCSNQLLLRSETFDDQDCHTELCVCSMVFRVFQNFQVCHQPH